MKITVGMGSCGIAAGADRICELLKQKSPDSVEITGCNGDCHLEPIVTVDGRVYTNVTESVIDDILGGVGDFTEVADPDPNRIALRNCGRINPEKIDDYIETGGYSDLTLTPEQIIEEVKISGLAGRGGAGFPTWFKWQSCRSASVGNSDFIGGESHQNVQKYVICNADEGDPGAFMDRAILEGDPHSVIEGMKICGKAIGSNSGIIYVRAEYPLAIRRLETAIHAARERRILGDEFDIRIITGAGAFVCGEETALIASLEGKRGTPRLKPPFPAQKGYRNQPSNINNVETFANVPWIIRNGGAKFAAIGTAPSENSKGTKVFALTGKVAKGGLVEVPMGKTIREIIYNYSGGIKDGKSLKAVQLGGPSGGCIPYSLIDTQIDYKALAETGAIMGSGGMVVMDESTCMVDMARYFLDFTVKESCGKCTHCRIGNKRLLEVLERICAGKGKVGDIDLLEELCNGIKTGSLCALGQTAPNPVLTTLKYFKNEYEEHIAGKCTAGTCRALTNYSIDLDKCKKCGLCMKKCPANAIVDLVIDGSKCTKCGVCVGVCRFEALVTL
ncbi:MAG: 4Fe-4S binding protein [Oscillospiraceae bacterium]|nr:4Fe-4S binding protein [Oscillospiraceae bacterium]